jgi:hypothetical protein
MDGASEEGEQVVKRHKVILILDDLDYEVVRRVIGVRERLMSLPDGDSNGDGAAIAEICRGYEEMLNAAGLEVRDEREWRVMKTVHKLETAKQAAVPPHFAEARRIVASWPDWKRNIGHGLDAGMETIMSDQVKTYDLRRIEGSEYNDQLEMVEAYKDTGIWIKASDVGHLLQEACEAATKAERERCIKEMVEPLVKAIRYWNSADGSVRPEEQSRANHALLRALAYVEAKMKENTNG